MFHVAIRTDASVHIGTGHVMRCLTLAAELRKFNAAVSFICREHPGNLLDFIVAQGFDVKRLPFVEVGTTPKTNDEIPWRRDAEETREAIDQMDAQPDWLVVDHYDLDYRWENMLRGCAKRIATIDDLADRPHDCDLLLDQNIVANPENRYDGLISAECIKLLGPRFVLLQPDYARLRRDVRPRTGPIRRILIYFGGTDSNNLTGIVIEAFLRLNCDDIEVDAVVGSSNSNLGKIRKQIAGCANMHLHTQQSSLASLLAAADFAIGACGATSWERLCLGVPALVITVAENQRAIASELKRRGLITWLGDQANVRASVVAKALANSISRGSDPEQSARCMQTVDGKGTALVAAMMMTSAESGLRIRALRPDDEKLLLEWANDPVTRQNSFSLAPISAQSHSEWFHAKLEKSDLRRFYIVETENGAPLGQVRFERNTREWEVHYLVAPLFRGRGLGAKILHAAVSELVRDQGTLSVTGRVKCENRASRKIFESLGFGSNTGTSGDLIYQRQF